VYTKKGGKAYMATRGKKVDPSEKQSVVDLAKDLGFAKVNDSNYNHIKDMVPTFIPQYDYILGGGIAFNRITEIFAPEQVGKSTFVMEVTKVLNHLGVTVFWIDTEGTADRDRMQELGIDTDKTFVSQPAKEDLTVEGVGEYLKKLMEAYSTPELKNTPVVVIWDSIGGTISEAQANTEYGEEGARGRHAAAITKVVQKTSHELSDLNMALIFVNQVRMNQNKMNKYQSDYIRPGGAALDHAEGLRIELRKGAQVKDKTEDKTYGGHILRMITDKSKQSRPHQKAEAYILASLPVDDKDPYGPVSDGVDYEYNIYETAKALKFITTGGSYRKYTTNAGQEINLYEKDFLKLLKSPEGKEIRKELFQKNFLSYFPDDFKPLHNETIDVTKWEDMKGIKEYYAKLKKQKAKDAKVPKENKVVEEEDVKNE